MLTNKKSTAVTIVATVITVLIIVSVIITIFLLWFPFTNKNENKVEDAENIARDEFRCEHIMFITTAPPHSGSSSAYAMHVFGITAVGTEILIYVPSSKKEKSHIEQFPFTKPFSEIWREIFNDNYPLDNEYYKYNFIHTFDSYDTMRKYTAIMPNTLATLVINKSLDAEYMLHFEIYTEFSKEMRHYYIAQSNGEVMWFVNNTQAI